MTNNQNTKEIMESLKDPLYVKVTIQYMNERNIAFGHQLDYDNYLEIAQKYHSERLITEQSAPIKSLQECKDEVARYWGTEEGNRPTFDDWKDFFVSIGEDTEEIELSMTKAAELYASQFRNRIEVTDKEIEVGAYDCGVIDDISAFEIGAKWMRDKLNK